MGYGEARQNKRVIIVDFNSTMPDVRDIQVPCFQPLERIVGSLDEIESRIEELKGQGSFAWLEIDYTGTSIVGNLREVMEEAILGSSMEIRRIKNRQVMENATLALEENETLDDLTVNDIFERCLDDHDVPQEEREELVTAYNEIVRSLYEDDVNAE
jgi:exonuclease SbcD